MKQGTLFSWSLISTRAGRAALFSAMTFGCMAICLADLDEEKFEEYSVGELAGQNDWLPQGLNEAGTYVVMQDRVEVQRDEAKGNQWIVWRSGFAGKDQTRVVKRFSETEGSKVDIRFDFLPGGGNLGGQLIFDQGRSGSFALRFLKGTLHVSNADTATFSDTGAEFEVDGWNRVELQFDFETHEVGVFLNGKEVGSFAISPSLSGFSQLVFFAGGMTFESGLDNLSVRSVESFSAPSKGGK